MTKFTTDTPVRYFAYEGAEARKARIVAIRSGDTAYPLVVLYADDGTEEVDSFTEDGRGSSGQRGAYLELAPAETSVFLNVYPHSIGSLEDSRADCDRWADNQRLAVLELIYEDGKPVRTALHPID